MRLYRYMLIALTGIILLAGALLGAPASRAVGIWVAAPSLTTPRSEQAALLLPDGRILFYGGAIAPVGDPTTGELYDPARGSQGVTKLRPDAQGQEAPVLLPDGRVLLTGGGLGSCCDPNFYHSIAAAQVYDPATDAYTPVAPLATNRLHHTATALRDGTVLVVGGNSGSGSRLGVGASAVARAERYDPATNRWSPAGDLVQARSGHVATLLQDGRVLVTGGEGNGLVAAAEVYDPAKNAWSSAGQLATARVGHTATVLRDGRVLVAGGIGDRSLNTRLAAAELYDPATNRWASAGSLADARAAHTATLIPDGRVLVAGGDRPAADGANRQALATTEIYDPASGRWAGGAVLDVPRTGQSATSLPDGRVLLAGGVDAAGPTITPLATAVFYGVATTPERCFRETGQCARGPFLAYWDAHGGLALNGYPLTEERVEVLEDGRAYQVQYFERVRLEYHPENAPPYDVLLGQFGRRIHPADPASVPIPGQTFFAETGHNLGGRFLEYWTTNGGLGQFGFPISEQRTERLEDGHSYTVQYFERARFESHPENPAPYDVLLGQFGRHILADVNLLQGPFAALYTTSAAVRAQAGRPTTAAVPSPGALQTFERGRMYYSSRGTGEYTGDRTIYVLCGTAEAGQVLSEQPAAYFRDTWAEGQDPGGGAAPGVGLFYPRRGFGKVWREHQQVQQCLGYATTATELSFPITVQFFGRGAMLLSDTPEGRYIYVISLTSRCNSCSVEGTYARFAVPPGR